MPVQLAERAAVFSALADPNRLKLIEMLAAEEELCGIDLARRAGISVALLSHHWKILDQAGLVVRERRGQKQYCQLNREALEAAFEFVWPQRRIRSFLNAG